MGFAFVGVGSGIKKWQGSVIEEEQMKNFGRASVWTKSLASLALILAMQACSVGPLTLPVDVVTQTPAVVTAEPGNVSAAPGGLTAAPGGLAAG